VNALAVTFWLSLFAILYAYVGYPAALWLMTRVAPGRARRAARLAAPLPSVTLIVSAFNEETVIGAKIANSLALDYPRELFEIVVVSDGSSDRTCEIVSGYSDAGVILRHYEGRIGKTACLNRAVPLASGEIVVFSDANSTYAGDALRTLVTPFEDLEVGFVTGWTRYGSSGDSSVADALGIYSRLELLTKELESRLHSCIGADGAIFAIRKSLYLPLRDYDINDLVIPLSINQHGYRGVLEPRAVCFETDAGSAKGEFRRQVRIASRSIRALMNYRRLLNPFAFGVLSFELLSHKLCKFLVPIVLLALLASSLLLAEHGRVYMAALAVQGAFYLAAGSAALMSNAGPLARAAGTARTFVVINAAIALAWIKYLQGETFTTWAPTKR
jgi:cellulose synthase/poly-beta-1,6-N-acetylglucosamine synthase-like glycosyltransferase